MSYRIGIDVGGTFTDLFLCGDDGQTDTFKVLSRPADPSVGVMDGLAAIAAKLGMPLGEFARAIHTIVHGTTVTTNATLTRNGATTGLLTTEGVRDALEMRRGIREEQYNNRFTNVVPLVPRHRRRPIRGRLDYTGQELRPLNLDDVREAAEFLKAQNVDAVAICFMNAFANPAHERQAAAIVRELLPEAYVSVSSEVLPVIRFYNRVSTTALNAYVGPVLRDYLSQLTRRLKDIGFGGTLLIMQSNGGVAVPEITAQFAAATLLSGPAAGPTAAVAYTRPEGHESCLVVDMGGTSFDASLVQNGRAALNTESDLDRLRIALPMLDICTIGAGGGSIGWIDDGGLLRMGPQSAGAMPGPVCYGRGGTRPTCTDADLLLGYLDAEYFAGGALPLNIEPARDAIRREIADPLGLSVDAAAVGMYRVINANMAHGVREITISRGLDPREFPLVVAGGAGALHACMIARELGIGTLVVPPTASVLCASGMLWSDLQHDFVRSLVGPLAELDPQQIRTLIADLIAQGTAELRGEGIAEARIEHRIAFDLRYLKQYHEVTLPVPFAAVETGDMAAIVAAFHGRHNQLYGYDLAAEGTGLELINVRVQSIGTTQKPALPRLESGPERPNEAARGTRRAFVPETDEFADVPCFDGHRLKAGNRIAGPALIERTDTTIFVSASFNARIDAFGSCWLTASEERAAHE